MTQRFSGQNKPREWFGVYLGRVSRTRLDDLWVCVNVPQLLGTDVSTTWARPMGFNSVGEINPPVANIYNDGEGLDMAYHPLGWGGFTPDPSGVAVTQPGTGTGSASTSIDAGGATAASILYNVGTEEGEKHTPLTAPADPQQSGYEFGSGGLGTGVTDQADDTGTGRHGRPVGSGTEAGPGPRPGTLVLVMFIAGDPNHPVYALTSQRIG